MSTFVFSSERVVCAIYAGGVLTVYENNLGMCRTSTDSSIMLYECDSGSWGGSETVVKMVNGKVQLFETVDFDDDIIQTYEKTYNTIYDYLKVWKYQIPLESLGSIKCAVTNLYECRKYSMEFLKSYQIIKNDNLRLAWRMACHTENNIVEYIMEHKSRLQWALIDSNHHGVGHYNIKRSFVRRVIGSTCEGDATNLSNIGALD
jgi:hypothetical protein